MARSTRLIRVPQQQAFDYLADLTRHHEWAINSLRVEPLEAGPIGAGARFRSTGTQFGATLRDEVSVTAYEPPRRFEFESVGRGGTFRHAFELEAAPEGTRVTKVMQPRRLPFPLSIFTPLTDVILRQRMARDLSRIAARLEGGRGA